MQILANNLLVEGLRQEFADTYTAIRNDQSDGRLSQVMDLSLTHDNRYGNLGYLEAAPHPERWIRGNSIPKDVMSSVQIEFNIWDWARRVSWHMHDREDDQTQSMFDGAQQAGRNFGLIPERIFFDLITNSTTGLLPAIPNAPDGAGMYSTTDGASANRFGVSSGNLLTGGGITTTHDVRNDFYAAIEQFMLFQDGKGQPLLPPELISSGVIIVHAAADTEIMEETFIQKRQAVGVDNTGLIGGTVVAGAAATNIVHDASRNVQLWGTPRLATLDWYVFLANPPKKATGYITRKALTESTSLQGDNNGDLTRDTGEEYIQWEERSGGVIALPYTTIKVNN